MQLKDRSILITGGAGFIGSYLASELNRENELIVIDNLSSGDLEYVPDGVEFHGIDILDKDELDRVLSPDIDIVFHLAANPDVRAGLDDVHKDLKENTIATNYLLEGLITNDIDTLAFTSTSTVYGEDVPLPTPESHGPLEPISLYGASKLGCEGLCTAYQGSFGLDVSIFRFANIVGGLGHGVIPDFIEKLRRDNSKLEILGDGAQEKSYLHVSRCVDAMIYAVVNGEDTFYNIGSGDTISVTEIADVVCEEMGVEPDYEYTGGERGWRGDVPKMMLSIEKLRSIGWKPEMDSRESIRRTATEILND